jgi:hypothetical protein
MEMAKDGCLLLVGVGHGIAIILFCGGAGDKVKGRCAWRLEAAWQSRIRAFSRRGTNSIQPVLDPQSRHGFEVGVIGIQDKHLS